jgi:hypothetical protein
LKFLKVSVCTLIFLMRCVFEWGFLCQHNELFSFTFDHFSTLKDIFNIDGCLWEKFPIRTKFAIRTCPNSELCQNCGTVISEIALSELQKSK